ILRSRRRTFGACIPPMVDRPVADGAQQIRPQRLLDNETITLLPERKEDILHDLLRRLTRANAVVRISKHRWCIVAKQLVERALITRTDARKTIGLWMIVWAGWHDSNIASGPSTHQPCMQVPALRLLLMIRLTVRLEKPDTAAMQWITTDA